MLGSGLSSVIFLLYIKDEVWEDPFGWFVHHQLRACVFQIGGTDGEAQRWWRQQNSRVIMACGMQSAGVKQKVYTHEKLAFTCQIQAQNCFFNLGEKKNHVCFRIIFLRRKSIPGRTGKALQEKIPLLTVGIKLVVSVARNKGLNICRFSHTCAVGYVSSTGTYG